MQPLRRPCRLRRFLSRTALGQTSANVGYRGVARGHRYGVARGYGVRRYGYSGYRRYGYGGYSRYGYRGYGYRGYRPGYGVVRRQVRRCALWGAGHVCRQWVY